MGNTVNALDTGCIVRCLVAPCVCVVGDALGAVPAVAHSALLRALVDSVTHGAVGAASWAAVIGPDGGRAGYGLQVLTAMALAMSLDTDHFIVARSWKLEAALSLPHRPPFHTTSVIPVFLALILAAQYLTGPRWWLDDLHWLFFVAWFSHQLRDAARRGLWFWPWGSTRPLPAWLYLTSIAVLPMLVRTMLKLRGHGGKLQNSSIDSVGTII